MDGAPLDPEQFGVIARLPGLDVLRGQLVGVVASPLTGLTRGLASMLSGLAVALGEIAEKGLVGGQADEPQAQAPAEPQPDAVADVPAAEQPEETLIGSRRPESPRRSRRSPQARSPPRLAKKSPSRRRSLPPPPSRSRSPRTPKARPPAAMMLMTIKDPATPE